MRRGGWRGGRRLPWNGGAIRDGRRTCSRGSSRHRARAIGRASCSADRGAPRPPRSAARNRDGPARRPAGPAARRAPRRGPRRHRPGRPALLVAAPRQQGQPDVVAPGEAACQRHGVVAGAARPRRDGRDIERQVELLDRHRNDRHSSMWARAAARQVRVDAYAAPRLASSARRTSSVRTAARPPAMSSTSSGSTMRAGRRSHRAEVVHARHLVGHHGRDADEHGLEGRQAVALRERHVGEGAGSPVQLGQDDVGNGAGEDDVVGGPWAPPAQGPTRSARRSPAATDRGASRAPGRRPAPAGPRSCEARACSR